MNKITQLLSQLAGAEAEIAEFDKLEQKAKANLTQDITANTTVADTKARILDARLTLDLTAAKKGQAEPLRDKIAADLRETLVRFVAHWNDSITEMREATEDEIIAANVKFFNGDERAARSWWDQGPMNAQPIFAQYHHAYYDPGVLRPALGRSANGRPLHAAPPKARRNFGHQTGRTGLRAGRIQTSLKSNPENLCKPSAEQSTRSCAFLTKRNTSRNSPPAMRRWICTTK
jgi:hypothetical protein